MNLYLIILLIMWSFFIGTLLSSNIMLEFGPNSIVLGNAPTMGLLLLRLKFYPLLFEYEALE